jgi:membrane associated rhomboid family serine protease
LYAIFYIVVGSAGALAHGIIDPGALTPAIGASGAIAGVMGAYIVLYPRATVATLIFFVPFPIPAFMLIGFWFVSQLFSGFSSLGVDAVGAGGGVAYFAHIGGFIAGALLVNVFAIRRGRPRPRRRAPRDPW